MALCFAYASQLLLIHRWANSKARCLASSEGTLDKPGNTTRLKLLTPKVGFKTQDVHLRVAPTVDQHVLQRRPGVGVVPLLPGFLQRGGNSAGVLKSAAPLSHRKVRGSFSENSAARLCPLLVQRGRVCKVLLSGRGEGGEGGLHTPQ